MKHGLKIFVLVAVTLAAQRLLGHPQTMPYAAALLLPMPWVIGPPLLALERRWYWLAFGIGLSWDLLFEPVIGTGAIAWSAPALCTWIGASIMAEQRTRAWFVFGAGGTLVFWLVRSICYFPLGLPGTPTWSWIGASALLTGLWCASVHAVLAFDLPARWRQRRTHRLRL
ncbi:MAG: hypothetical protein DRJ65_11570 [Acidobacteria bacterium]|nr:MAG: hypothetical protein DRJ65_11570 [Acidobacteriota bacterium]